MRIPITLVASLGASLASPASPPIFEAPIRIQAASGAIAVPAPGFACPTVADVDGDGSLDLVVGQFKNGALTFYRNTAAPGETPILAKGIPLTTEGKPAQVPGVW